MAYLPLGFMAKVQHESRNLSGMCAIRNARPQRRSESIPVAFTRSGDHHATTISKMGANAGSDHGTSLALRRKQHQNACLAPKHAGLEEQEMGRTAYCLAIGLGLMATVVAVRADLRETGIELQFYAPAAPWKIVIPKDDWIISEEKRRTDGEGFYYQLESLNLALYLTVYLDKTNKCSSGETCRALFVEDLGPMAKQMKDPQRYEKNGFHVIQFHLDGVGGIPLKQSNLSAHMYRDGYWIDIRITKVGKDSVPDPKSLITFLESIVVQ
jgi:hypothetical protein